MALGDLGPPQLSKYLFELYLIRAEYGTLENDGRRACANRMPPPGSRPACERCPTCATTIVSVGIPILMPDGGTFLRGPEIKIPGYDPSVAPRRTARRRSTRTRAKGWVDLRAENLARWATRLDHVIASRRGGSAGASDAMGHDTYGRDDFRTGEVVAWVFANEPEFHGFRIK